MSASFAASGSRQIQSKNCFVCGRENPNGLNIPFFFDGDRVTARLTTNANHCGFDGIVHGGILFALADEAMMHLIWASGLKAITAEVIIRFHDFAAIGEEIVIESSFVDKSPRLIKAMCLLAKPDGSKIATARGKFLPFSDFETGIFKKTF